MHEKYEPVFLPTASIVAKKYKEGDIIKFKVTSVMDDGVKAVCSHTDKNSDGRKEMVENVKSRYRDAIRGETENATNSNTNTTAGSMY